MLLIKNGRVYRPGDEDRCDARCACSMASASRKSGQILTAPDAEIFDATGLIVAPGFIDLHCHLREPGQEMSETIETGTRVGRARRIHGRLLHAQYAAGERQRFGDARNRRARRSRRAPCASGRLARLRSAAKAKPLRKSRR